MKDHALPTMVTTLLIGILIAGCTGGSETDSETTPPGWNTIQDTTDRVAVIEGGLQGPEAVQYAPGQDVYFISNFNGGGTTADSNGFITRARPDGTIEELKFITGTDAQPLHAPRGMYIIGDTLFVADLKGIHGFDRYTGKPLSFIDFTTYEPGFLNDVTMGPDSALYITDSGKPVLYRVSDGEISVAADSLPHTTNGIMYDKASKKIIMAAWGDGQRFLTWDAADATIGDAGTGAETGGYYDGIEPIDENFIVTSQADSTLQLVQDGEGQVFIRTPGQPADIGLDTKRRQVAVPYIALDRVDIWQLPPKN